MRKPRGRKRAASAGAGAGTGEGSATMDGSTMEPAAPGTTGRYLVLMREDAVDKGVKALGSIGGVRVARTADFTDKVVAGDPLEEHTEEALFFDELAVAVVDAPPDQIRALSTAAREDTGILAVEPERVVYALPPDPPARAADIVAPPPVGTAPVAAGAPVEYLRGYRDAVNHLVDKLLAESGVADGAVEEAAAVRMDESELTWGLQATRAAASPFTGRGVRVAVLDTGLDLDHGDFAGRRIVSRSFILGESAQDGHGHGTHCVGTACGAQQPGVLPRYGVACDADIFVGKVLSNRGSGGDRGILAGIQWAIMNRCAIVSMSLGAPVFPGQHHSQIFEQVARRALLAGTVIIAAAGNESQRPWSIAPVGHPANCPSIMAVGALDMRMQVARFSSGGLNPQGGQVDIAGPGVAVRSAWPRPVLYHTISGTSMATPHVAGIAAQFAEADPKARGRSLLGLLTQSARRLPLPARDVGAGLVQAPA